MSSDVETLLKNSSFRVSTLHRYSSNGAFYEASQGSGNAYKVRMSDGSQRNYLITNRHVIDPRPYGHDVAGITIKDGKDKGVYVLAQHETGYTFAKYVAGYCPHERGFLPRRFDTDLAALELVDPKSPIAQQLDEMIDKKSLGIPPDKTLSGLSFSTIAFNPNMGTPNFWGNLTAVGYPGNVDGKQEKTGGQFATHSLLSGSLESMFKDVFTTGSHVTISGSSLRPGYSGSTILDENGKLVGVNTATGMVNKSTSFAVPAAKVTELVNLIAQNPGHDFPIERDASCSGENPNRLGLLNPSIAQPSNKSEPRTK